MRIPPCCGQPSPSSLPLNPIPSSSSAGPIVREIPGLATWPCPAADESRATADLAGTAIRETAEEVGVQLRPEDLIGSLPDVIPRTPVLPPIAVRPFVFLLPERPAMRLNAEVAQASWVPVDYLLRPDTHHPVQLEVAGKSRQVQAYQLENAIIWGMTERILTSFLAEVG